MKEVWLFRLLPVPALLMGLGAPLLAQEEPEGDPAATGQQEIVVVGERYRGSVDAAQPPLVELDEADIASYGAGSITELLEALAPQTGSARGRGEGRPVILVNGQRVANFRELRRYSPEAIRKVEVLPEEVAMRFGYPPDQRVVNFILKDNFVSREIEVEYGVPGEGGYSAKEAELTWLSIDGPRRYNLSLDLSDTSLLSEAERGVVQESGSIPGVATDPDPARWRSLVADSSEIELDGAFTTGLGEGGGTIGVNANLARTDSRSLSGLDRVLLTAPDGASLLRTFNPDNPLERDSRTTTFSASSTLNRPFGGWNMTATIDASHARSRTRIDQRANTAEVEELAASGDLALDAPLPAIAPGGVDVARSAASAASALATATGSLLRLPAGSLTTTLDLGFDWDRIVSRDTRIAGVRTRLTRGDVGGGVNLAIPITSRREGVWDAIGDLTLNLNGGVNHLSDFGTLTDYSTGLTWKPTEKLTLQASYIARDAAPSLGNLGDPQVTNLNVPVYDFVTGQTVLATTIGGGNPLLDKESQRDIKLSANWDLPILRRSSLIVEYVRNRSSDVTASFPLLTPAVEAAFPGRVIRDASGQLVSVDRRPVTFARQKSSRLRYGFDLSGNLGRAQVPGEAGARGGGGRGSGAPSPMAMMGGRGAGQGRWSASVYHTIALTNKVQLATGGPVLDLLDGDAISDSGGAPRHKVTAEGGVFHKGLGFRLNASYESATRAEASGLPGSSDLRFGSLATINLRLFMDLGEQRWLSAEPGFLKDMRVMLRVDNLFDERRRVTDGNGEVPLRYQPDLIDPIGQFLEIELRKVF